VDCPPTPEIELDPGTLRQVVAAINAYRHHFATFSDTVLIELDAMRDLVNAAIEGQAERIVIKVVKTIR
jgi:hypothetical protein